MSDIITLYNTKVDQIYDKVSELQRLENEKADSFIPLSKFRQYILV